MATTLHFSKANDLAQLHDALLAAGVVPLSVQGLGIDITLVVQDADVATATATVTAYVQTARPPTAVQTLRTSLAAATTIADVLAALRAFYTSVTPVVR